MQEEPSRKRWVLLSNHGAVLLYVAQHPTATIREISEGADLTERATARILAELRKDGYVVALRKGRRNSYVIPPELPMRHPVALGLLVAQFLASLAPPNRLAPEAPPDSDP